MYGFGFCDTSWFSGAFVFSFGGKSFFTRFLDEFTEKIDFYGVLDRLWGDDLDPLPGRKNLRSHHFGDTRVSFQKKCSFGFLLAKTLTFLLSFLGGNRFFGRSPFLKKPSFSQVKRRRANTLCTRDWASPACEVRLGDLLSVRAARRCASTQEKAPQALC